MTQNRELIIEQQKHLQRMNYPHVPLDDMIKPTWHNLDGFRALTSSLPPFGTPVGYIGVEADHPLNRVSEADVNKLEDDLGITWAGYSPVAVVMEEGTASTIWYFGIDTGDNLKATRQDLIEHLRAIAVFLTSRK